MTTLKGRIRLLRGLVLALAVPISVEIDVYHRSGGAVWISCGCIAILIGQGDLGWRWRRVELALLRKHRLRRGIETLRACLFCLGFGLLAAGAVHLAAHPNLPVTFLVVAAGTAVPTGALLYRRQQDTRPNR